MGNQIVKANREWPPKKPPVLDNTVDWTVCKPAHYEYSNGMRSAVATHCSR